MIRRLALAIAAVLALAAGIASTAFAAAPGPHWSLHVLPLPSSFSPDDNAECLKTDKASPTGNACDAYQVTALNTGSAAASGAVSLTDTLPPGLTVQNVQLFRVDGTHPNSNLGNLAPGNCNAATLHCSLHATFTSDEGLELLVYVTVEPGASDPLVDHAQLEGGKAATAGAEAQASLSGPTPPFGVALFSEVTGLDGQVEPQAGAHPFELNTRVDLASAMGVGPTGQTNPNSVEDPRDIAVDLPLGFLGTAVATPTCKFSELSANISAGSGGCPSDTIVGRIYTEPVGSNDAVGGPIYNMTPERGVAAEFAYVDVLAGTHVLYASVVPGSEGYLLRTTAPELPQVPLTDIVTSFYGNPERRNGGASEGQPEVPLFTNPADCNGRPLVTAIHIDSWQNPGRFLPDGEPDLGDPAWVTSTSASPPVSGCNQLEGLFDPTLEAKPTTTQGDRPSGFEVALSVPQHEAVGTLATPPLRKAVVTLPQGMSVNPSSANGLEGCSLAQIGVSPSGQPNGEPVRCPDAAKIGKLELESPDLPGILDGQIYVAKQSENPFGSLLAIYLVVVDPATGVLVKIPGEVRADPNTGQLTTVIDNSPQFPFSELRTKFFGGQKAALRTPAVCGKYEVTASLTPWSAPESGPPAEPAGSFEITEGCSPSAAQQPNHPAFEAGTVSPLAGAYSPFVLKLHREDGSQELSGLSVTLPEGLLGKLAGIEECPEAQIALAKSREREGGGAEELASPSCPPGSEVGSVTVGAGAGLEPYFTSGHAYLAGPYKGAPLSLVIVTPAVAGPYDLGDVVVRTALEVDPYSARITAVSDPIPHVLQGIPLDVRSISLQMSRPNFTLNPTNCEAMTIGGTASSVLGQSAPLSNRFQVGGCNALGFKPKLALSLNGATRRSGHPALKAVLTYPKGAYANIAYAQVSLPHTLFLDQGNLNKVCTQPELATRTCPPTSVYGRAKAWTPLLEKPLEGNVYLGVGFGHELPDLVGELNGQIRVLLHGKVDTDKADGLRNTFEVVPDAPVSKFVLELKGGRKYGLLENHENVCLKQQRAGAKFIGQNGKVDTFRPVIATGCKGKKGGHRKHHGRRR